MSAAAKAANYVLTLEEIGSLAKEGGKPADTLMNVVALIATRFRTDVCSAYLLEPDRANLVMAATLGLTIDVHYKKSHYDKMVTKALSRDGVVLIAWQHEDIPLLTKDKQPGISQSILTQTQTSAKKFNIPQTWPSGPQGARYDLIFVFDRPTGEGPIESFSLVAQMLLFGDASPPKLV